MSLEERIEKLERELTRAYRLLAVLCAGSVLTIVFMASGKPSAQEEILNTIRAKTVYIVDENDKIRIQLSGLDPVRGLSLYNDSGNTRAVLAESKDGPYFSLYDEKGNSRAVLALTKNGPGLSLFDRNGNVEGSVP